MTPTSQFIKARKISIFQLSHLFYDAQCLTEHKLQTKDSRPMFGHLVAGKSWASYLTSLNLSFPVGRTKTLLRIIMKMNKLTS